MAGRLVAVVAQGGPAFVDELRRAWDDGDAVAPVDPRLPLSLRRRLLATLRPAMLVVPGGERSRRAGEPVEPGDALVVATSGTTGEPRGVVLTHGAVAASARATSDRLRVDPGADRWLACLPLAHVGGLAVVTRALLTGTPLEVQEGFDADAVMAAARRGSTLVSLVPAVLGRIDPSVFRAVLLGGSAIPTERPANCIATYGMTETGSGVVYDGRPLGGVEVDVVDDEILLRGPMLLRAYRDGTDPRRADGWYPTGDLGEWAPDGRLVVHGRRGDVIVTGGEKVWPEPVEARLRAHAEVADAAVVGRPDPEWGQQVVAVVVPADVSAPPSLGELRDWVKAVQPVWCAPRRLQVVGSLPRTALGKLQRGRLTELG